MCRAFYVHYRDACGGVPAGCELVDLYRLRFIWRKQELHMPKSKKVNGTYLTATFKYNNTNDEMLLLETKRAHVETDKKAIVPG